MSKITESLTPEYATFSSPAHEVVVIELAALEILEVAEQGPPGPPGGGEAFDTDLVLIYEIAKL